MIDILLSAYNGERYLPELLESLARQSYGDFSVIARDDGSTDGTLALLQEQSERDRRFIALPGTPSGSASGGFFAALALSEGDYTMFCDQDDVWHRNKVERSMTVMRTAEECCGRDTPLLIHTDLRVVDSRLRQLSPSMMRSQLLCPERCDLPRLLCQSLVTGCTMMINAPLRRLVLSALPERCLMYDWWISLVAEAFGRIVYVNEATIDYRQHGGNQVGAKNVRSVDYLLRRLGQGKEAQQSLRDTCEQAGEFLRCFGGQLTPEQRLLLRSYAALPSLPRRERLRMVHRLGTLKCGAARRAGQLLFWGI